MGNHNLWFPIFGNRLGLIFILLGLPIPFHPSFFPSFFPSIICRFDIFGVDIRIRKGGRASEREGTEWSVDPVSLNPKQRNTAL